MPPVTIDGTSGITTPMYGGAITSNAVTPVIGMKNKIINGACVIDQRNAGASVTPTTSTYTLDRWQAGANVSSKYSVQQNAGSVTPPAGFTNYLGVTSLSTYSVGSSDNLNINQFIEGFNTADLGWGTANAKTVTLSFWVRSSLTGTFGGAILNSAVDRSYPYTYTISSANTWEQKSITIAGDTSGTWLTTNGIGVRLYFGIGVGSTLSGTAGAWAGATYVSATGATSVVGTNGATFYITGVQLEVGSTATSFDYRPYGTELQLCQRYYYQITTGANYFATGILTSASAARAIIQLPVPMRTAPTGVSATASVWGFNAFASGASTGGTISFQSASTTPTSVQVTISGGTSSGAGAGTGCAFYSTNATDYVGFTGTEL